MSYGLNQYLTLRMAGITSKQKISFSPGGRIIRICSRLRRPESPLRATCSLQVHMQSKRLKSIIMEPIFQMRNLRLRDLIKVIQLSMWNARANLGSFSSVAQSCPTICNSMNHSMPILPVYHLLPEFTQAHVHRVSDAIQPSHPLSSPSPPVSKPSQHQGLFQWANSSYEVAKVLEFQPQHQSFQWIFRTDFL